MARWWPPSAAADLLSLLRSPRWVYRQYDHQLFLNTVVAPGGDAAVLRAAGPGLPAVRARRGGDHRFEPPLLRPRPPRRLTALTLAEGVANLACVGATAVAVVNCSNFRNPEHAEVMWQLSECIDGMAARAAGRCRCPSSAATSSLYNESGGADIDPTPCAGCAGVGGRPGAGREPPGMGWADGDTVVLVGPRWAGAGVGGEAEPFPLAGTLLGHRAPPAPVRLPARGRSGNGTGEGCAASWPVDRPPMVGGATEPPLVSAVHDVSSGGLGLALAEMAVAGAVGCHVALGRGRRALQRAAVTLRDRHADARRARCPGRGVGDRRRDAGPSRRP